MKTAALVVLILAGLEGSALAEPAPVAAPPVAAETLDLQCDGISEYEGDSSGLAFSGGGVGSLFGMGSARSPDQVLVEIKGDVGRVKLPAHLLNWAHNKDSDSWKTLSKFRMTDTEITGGYHIDIIENPSVRIDRITGHISIHAAAPYNFSGECQRYDAAARKF